MSASKKTKGDMLERAYRILQEHIIKNDPKLNASTFHFENNVIDFPGGVKYEIDIKITINKGTEFESTFLVECKNWNTRKASPEKISHFIEKIRAFNATKGYFLSTGFSKFARARGEQEGRLTLLKVKNDFPFPHLAGGFAFELKKWREFPKIGLLEQYDPQDPLLVNWDKSIDEWPYVTYRNKRMGLDEFVQIIVDEASLAICKNQERLPLKPGVNEIERILIISTNNLQIECESEIPRILIRFKIFIVKPKSLMSSSFSIEKRGYVESASFQIPCTSAEIELDSLLMDEQMNPDEFQIGKAKNLVSTSPEIGRISYLRFNLSEEFIENLISELNKAKIAGSYYDYLHKISNLELNPKYL